MHALYPGRYDHSQLKEQIFQGMHPHLRDSMWFSYMKEEVGYEEFLTAVYEAGTEGSEGKVVNIKAKALTVEKIVENREQNELKDLRQQIESLATIMKSAMIGGTKSKVMGGVSSPRKKEVSGTSPQKVFQGSPRKVKGPLKPGQKPIKCYRCDGWGHGWRECPTLENLNCEGTSGSCSFLNSLEVLAPLPFKPQIKIHDLQNSKTE